METRGSVPDLQADKALVSEWCGLKSKRFFHHPLDYPSTTTTTHLPNRAFSPQMLGRGTPTTHSNLRESYVVVHAQTHHVT